jgi:KDO2-lipid IV(A) lauroyltransferase
LSEAERERIARGSFRSLGRLLGEISQFPRLNRQNIESLVVYAGLENYLAAVARGRGVIFLTGHIGAWELSVYAHSVYGYPSSFLARRVDNPLIERIAENYRTMYGNRSIDKKLGVREVIRTLRAGGVVGILADLNSLREEGVFCDFFGVQASTTVGVATLAMRTGAVVLPGYLVWDEATKRHILHFEPPVETILTGNREADVFANTARYTKVIENIIRRYPDQWLWIHRRWRTRPEGEASLYSNHELQDISDDIRIDLYRRDWRQDAVGGNYDGRADAPAVGSLPWSLACPDGSLADRSDAWSGSRQSHQR